MVEFIAKYWLEFVFGILTAGLGFLSRYFYGLYKKEKQHQKSEEHQSLSDELKDISMKEHQALLDIIDKNKKESQKADKRIQEEIDETIASLKTLKLGVLGIQGRDFKTDCRALLEIDHVITQEEWEEISTAHDIYNSLGGNHDGDRLYNDVSIKYHDNLTK